MIELPNQRISRGAKEEDSFYKATYDHFIDRAISLNSKVDVTVWLEAANGIISDDSIKYITTPLMDPETRKTIGKLPGEIRDTDLINMIRERNMGEYIGLPYKYTVTVHNSDAVLRRDLEIRDEVAPIMEQALINMLNEFYGEQQNSENPQPAINTGIPSKELPDIEKFTKDFLENWIDKRAEDGYHLLNLINAINDFDTKRIQSFFYWWACEEFYTYHEIINGEVYTSNISPLEGYPVYNGEQFVEDYTAFVIKKKTTLTKVKELYWNQFSKVEQDYLTSMSRKPGKPYTVVGEWLASRTWDPSTRSKYRMNGSIDFDITDSSEALFEYTVIWRTEVPVKIRTFIDALGQENEEVVPESYEKIEGIDLNVRTEWIEEVYIGKRFGNAIEGVYLKPKPCDVQRYDVHTMIPKLPVGGKKGILTNIKQNPIPKRLIPYVLIDRLILVQQERTLAKYQGYITTIPKSLLNDDSLGTRNEKLFYLKADNTLMYDDTLVDFNTVAQGFRVVGMPAIENFLKVLIELRQQNKAEGLEIANMNQARLGDVMASTGKGVMEQQIYRAALGNVLSITMFNAALQRDHTADLEFSKIAYNETKRGSYIDRSTGKAIYVDLNLTDHRESQYGIFVENAKIDQEKIDMFRKIAFNASQNGDIDSAVAAVEYDSVPELRRALKTISAAQKELTAAVEAERNATQKYIADQQTIRQDSINETSTKNTMISADASRDVAELKLSGDQPDTEVHEYNTADGDKLSFQKEQLDFKKQDANAKNILKEKQLNHTVQNNREKLKIQKNRPTSNK